MTQRTHANDLNVIVGYHDVLTPPRCHGEAGELLILYSQYDTINKILFVVVVLLYCYHTTTTVVVLTYNITRRRTTLISQCT